MNGTKLIRTSLLALVLALSGVSCRAHNGGAGNTAAGVGKPAAQAGVQFTKLAVGLPSRTLDYIGATPFGLAGARPAEKVYFAVAEQQLGADQTTCAIYCRDLKSGKRTAIGTVERMERASLAASSDGRFLIYCRSWDIASFIDDPAVTQPGSVAVVMRMDVKTSKSDEVFNFRDQALRRYRSDSLAPFISADGSKIMVLAYDFDQALLARHLSDWVAYEQSFRRERKGLTKSEVEDRLKIMRVLTQDARVAPLLKAKGPAPSTVGEIPATEVAAMRQLAGEHSQVQAAVLIWQGGKTSVLPVRFAPGTERMYHFIFAAGDHTLLLGAGSRSDSAYRPQKVYRCDLASGQVSEFTALPGPPSVLQLDAREENLLAVYNPLDAAQKEILPESHLLRVGLASGAAQDTKLPADFFGYADLSADGATVIGQDRGDSCLYIVNAATGAKHMLLQLLTPVDGLFLAGTARCLAYLDSGLLFEVEIPKVPAQSRDWIKADYFEQYKPALTGFLTQLGFTLPAAPEYRWEEREGMGAHEVGAEVRDPAKPGLPALLRYSAADAKVVSIWFPHGYGFPVDGKLRGSNLDYYGCKSIAEESLARSGWLPSKTRQIYQPSANPLYDGRTNSYIITFRDGYWLGKGDAAKWVVNQEVTTRIGAKDGTLLEMTLAAYPQAPPQPFTISVEKAIYQIRNTGEMKIPEQAPVRFDTEHVRYAVATKYEDGFGPAKYGAKAVYRLCYEIDAYIMPEDELIMTSRVDTETGELLGSLNFQPSNIAPVRGD